MDLKLIDGVPHWSARGADAFSPFKSGASGTLVVVSNFNMNMNNRDGLGGNFSGNKITATIKITNGVITSSTISGGGYACTISNEPKASNCSASGFQITSVTWTPD